MAAARELETGGACRPRGGAWRDRFSGPLWQFVEQALPEAFRRALSVRQACDLWYSGAYLPETVPSVLFILMVSFTARTTASSDDGRVFELLRQAEAAWARR